MSNQQTAERGTLALVKQLAFFGAESGEPSPADLEGLLAGPGQVTRMGGTARVSIVVDSRVRAGVLRAELAVRGLRATVEPVTTPGGSASDGPVAHEPVGAAHGTDKGHETDHPLEPASDAAISVRTQYAVLLSGLAGRWLRGSVKTAPADLTLDGQRLRLWFAAAGYGDGSGAYTLRLGPSDGEALWRRSGRALAAAGLPAVLLSPGAGGPAYRIAGRRRVARLAELIGQPPAGMPAGVWPG